MHINVFYCDYFTFSFYKRSSFGLFFFSVCGSIISVFMCANKSILNSAELSHEFFYSCKVLAEPVVSGYVFCFLFFTVSCVLNLGLFFAVSTSGVLFVSVCYQSGLDHQQPPPVQSVAEDVHVTCAGDEPSHFESCNEIVEFNVFISSFSSR